MILLISLGSIVLLILIITWIIYNQLVNAHNVIEEAFSGIDIQLKKRFELIPNLIEAVKGYNAHEAEVLTQIVTQRSSQNQNIKQTATEDQSITSSLKNFRIQVENYPDLRANTQFLKLMDNLSIVENELSMARRYYNGTVRDYNTKIEVFPAVLVAKTFGHKAVDFYEINDANERQTPKVDIHA